MKLLKRWSGLDSLLVAVNFVLLAVVLVMLSGVAQASDDYFEQYGYEEEMNRCIDLLRPSLRATASDRVIYDVQEIDLRGAWYRFEISATVVDAAGMSKIDNYRVGCQSNRWVEVARLLERPNKQQLQSELLASK